MREERRRREEAIEVPESPVEEAPELPPPGALHEARTRTMAAAFHRLIAVMLGEVYRPVNLQERIARLQRARDIIFPYRYDSFQRVLDLAAINVELVQLGRMLDEL